MIRIDNTSVRYDSRAVLSDISFALEQGETLALLGPNGAGKTTLIRALNRSTEIFDGAIWIAGVPITKLSRRDVAKQIAVVAQENATAEFRSVPGLIHYAVWRVKVVLRRHPRLRAVLKRALGKNQDSSHSDDE